MNILVYGVAADSGGALSVLMDFYKEFKVHKENHYYFVVSTPQLDECDNITVLRYPEIKKGWGQRLFFEYVEAPKLVKKYAIDEVFSTTNTVIPRVQAKQILYLHQSLPFIPYRFSWKENRLFWLYQNIIGRLIIQSVKKADQVIVQTKWIRDAASRICHVPTDKFLIKTPQVDISLVKPYDPPAGNPVFFYPASPYTYKNHWLIVKACKNLKEQGITAYQVIFTLSGEENGYAKSLREYVEKEQLPVQFIGQIDRKEVFEWYSHSVLLFPSYIETFGMPLLEARLSNSPILAADTPFSREILQGYEKSRFYDIHDDKKLVQGMAHEVEMNNMYALNVNRGGSTLLTYWGLKTILMKVGFYPLCSYHNSTLAAQKAA